MFLLFILGFFLQEDSSGGGRLDFVHEYKSFLVFKDGVFQALTSLSYESSRTPLFLILNSFNVFANGTFKGQGFKFKLKLSSDDPAQNISVEQAGYSASFESRTEQSSGTLDTLNSSNVPAAKAVTFGKPFFTGTSSTDGGLDAYLPTVGVTIQNAQAGDFFTITSLSKTGFTINIKNPNETSNNGYVDRNFTYQAVGYGKGV